MYFKRVPVLFLVDYFLDLVEKWEILKATCQMLLFTYRVIDMQWSRKSRPLHAKASERVRRWLLGMQENYIHEQAKVGFTFFIFFSVQIIYGSTFVLFITRPVSLH